MKDKIVLLFLLICALQSRATSYYVNDASQAGDIYTAAVGNNANPGTAARPFATLAHALGVAVAGDSIFIDAGSYSDNNLSVTQANLVVTGAGSTQTVFNNNFASANTNYLLKIFANGVKISGIMAIRYNTTNVNEGRAITISGATGVVLSDVVFTNNDGSGGGNASLMILDNSSVNIKRGSFSCNPSGGAANDYGGGIDITGQHIRVTIDSSVMSNNGRTSWYGGGVYIAGDSSTVVSITNCSVSGNTAMDGGAIYTTILSTLSSSTPGPQLTVRNSCFNANTSQDISAFSYGGAVTVFSGKVGLYNCSFTSNQGGVGGAIAANSNDGAISLVVDSCSFSGNSTTQANSGYDIYARVAFSHSTSVTCLQNTFSGAASSVDNANSAVVSVSNSGNPGTTGSGGTVTFINTTASSWATITNCPAISGSCVCQTPVINSAAPDSVICSGSVFTTNLSSSTPSVYTSYSWTSTAVTGITGHSTSGTGNISETLTNTTSGPLTVTYTITPRFNGLCNGPATIYSVVVTPKPVMTSANATSICSGLALNFQLTSSFASTFNWVAANNPNTTGESTTLRTGSFITDDIINTTGSTQVVNYTVTPVSVSGGCSGNAQTVAVSVRPTPLMTSADTLAVCTGSRISIPLTSNVSATYSWVAVNNVNTSGQDTVAQNSAVISDTVTNNTQVPQVVTYLVTPTSVSGTCIGSVQSVAVTVYPLPQVIISPPATLTCSNTQVSLFARATPANAGYSWSGGSSVNTQTVVAPGNYTVTVTAYPPGCTASASVSVNQNIVAPVVNISHPDTLTCVVLNDTLVAYSPGTGAIYNWGDGATGSSISLSSAGTYTVTATDTLNGCTAVVSALIVQSITPPSVSIGLPDTLTCNISSVVLYATSSTPGATFLWSGGATTGNETVSSPGNYSVTVTDPHNGCTATASKQVVQNITLPTVSIAAPDTLTCVTTMTTLTAVSTPPVVTFAWSGGGVSGSKTVNIPGNYSVTVINSGNGCSASASVTVLQNIQVPTVNIARPDTLNCVQTSVVLAASSNAGGATFVWSGGGTTNHKTVTNPGGYSVTVTDPANGCTASASTEVAVGTSSIPLNLVDSASSNPICVGSNLLLTAHATGATSWLWTGPAGFSVAAQNASVTGFQNTNAGVYVISATNTCGTATDTIVIAIDSLPVQVTATASTTSACVGSAVNLTGLATGATGYNWTGPHGFTSTLQDPGIVSVSLADSGLYVLTASNICGSAGAGVLINVDTNLQLSGAMAGPNDTLCAGSAIHLSATGNHVSNWSWTGPAGFSSSLQNANINSSTLANSGAYVVTAGNACGVKRDTILVLIESDTLNLFASSSALHDSVCAGQNINLSASGSFDYFQWTGPNGFSSSNQNPVINNITNAGNGNYLVTAGNVCGSKTDTVKIIINNPPDQLNIATNTGGNSFCQGADIVLTAGANNAVGLQWNTPSGNLINSDSVVLINIQPAQEGTYYVTANNTCGNSLDSIVVSIHILPGSLLVSASKDSICPGAVATLVATSGVNGIQWSTGSIADSLLVSQPGSYYYTARDTNGCIEFSDTLTVFRAVPPVLDLLSSNHTRICTGQQQLTLLSTSDAQAAVTWNPGNILADSLHVTATGEYYVTAEKNGCTVSDSIRVSPYGLPGVTFTDTSISTCCTDVTVTPALTGNLLSYQWSDGSTAVSDLLDHSGLYTLTVSTSDGCTASGRVNFNKVCLEVQALAGPDTVNIESTTQLNAQTTVAGNFSYSWQPADNLQGANTINPVAKPGSNETYSVFVRDSVSGCVDSSSVSVVVIYQANYGVPNVFSPNGDGNNDTWHIVNQGNLVTVQDIKIFDRWGELVFSSERDGNIEWNGKYEGKLQPMGNYVYNVRLKINATNEEKFLKGNLSLLW